MTFTAWMLVVLGSEILVYAIDILEFLTRSDDEPKEKAEIAWVKDDMFE